MYLFIKKNFNLKNLVYFLTSIIILFSIILFLFFTKFGFYVSGVSNEITGTYLPSYYEYFTGFEIITFQANFYYKYISLSLNISAILFFVLLITTLIITVYYFLKKTNQTTKLKYLSGVSLVVGTIVFNVISILEIDRNNVILIIMFVIVYLCSFLLIFYEAIYSLIQNYLIDSKTGKDKKGYFIVTSKHVVLNLEEIIEKKFYSLSKAETYINNIKNQNHKDISIEKH